MIVDQADEAYTCAVLVREGFSIMRERVNDDTATSTNSKAKVGFACHRDQVLVSQINGLRALDAKHMHSDVDGFDLCSMK